MSNNNDVIIKIDDSTAKGSVEANKFNQNKKQSKSIVLTLLILYSQYTQ